MLQEVHCSEETLHLWASERGYKSLFSSFSSSKGGVSILLITTLTSKLRKPVLTNQTVTLYAIQRQMENA